MEKNEAVREWCFREASGLLGHLLGKTLTLTSNSKTINVNMGAFIAATIDAARQIEKYISSEQKHSNRP